MKPVIYRNKGLKIANYWFSSPENEPVKCDIVSFIDLKKPIAKVSKNIMLRSTQTLVNDLSVPIDKLFSKIQSNTRNQIRKAEKDGVVTSFYSSEDILKHPQILNEFIEVHKQFLISKHMKGRCNKSQLEAYCRANMLALSTAAYEGSNIVFHVYIGNGQLTRLRYSVSLFRNESQSSNKNLYGNANRLLHWKDMCRFKELGYSYYDWGGYSKLKELQNINQFKELFGGEIEDRYHYTIPNSFLGSLALLANRLISSVRALKFRSRH